MSIRARPGGSGGLVWFHVGGQAALAQVEALMEQVVRQETKASAIRTLKPGALSPESVEKEGALALWPDDPRELNRFLNHVSPDVGVLFGAIPSPEVLLQATRRDMPLILVDGHRIAGSPGWRILGRRTRSRLLSAVTHFFVATEEDVAVLLENGVEDARIERHGFLEDEDAALPCNERDRVSLAAGLAARPVWLAAAVQPAEIGAVTEAHRIASRVSHRLLLILVPAQPDAGPALRDRLADEGWRVALRSDGAEPDAETQVYVADSPGEMGLWYRLAPITFLAGSLLPPGGGLDPFGPAALGSAVLHGPHVGANAPRLARLADVGAARVVSGGTELGRTVGDLISPEEAAIMAHRAWEVVSEGALVKDHVAAAIAAALRHQGQTRARP